MEQSFSQKGIYRNYIKRLLDIVLSLLFIICFFWVYIIIAVLVRVKLGSPVLFTQDRPGKDEKIFKLYKFRSMTDKRDSEGKLLPDDQRLTKFGKMLRASSLDELPEIFNILKGDMSIVGPRPLLVKDMIFMTDIQRQRHTVAQGLTGLAQVNGRNNISWEGKLDLDLYYVYNISFVLDAKIIIKTFAKVISRADIVRDGTESDLDFGDYLLKKKYISEEEYTKKMETLKLYTR